MRIGLFGGAQSVGPDPARGYRDYLNFVLEAEAVGYHAAFMTEHHFTGWGQVSAPLHMLTWLAARTTRIRLGTAVMVLAWHNPMLLAEQVATVDLLSGGRLDLGVGRGYRHNEFSGFAIDAAEAEARFVESMTVMTRAWTTGDRFSHRGRFWRFDDVLLEPPVSQRPHPPIWVSAGQEASIRRAAEAGYHLLLDQFTPVDIIAERIALYQTTIEATGRCFDPFSVAVARDVYVAIDAADTADGLRRRAAGHQRMIDVARSPGQQGGSHILAWANRPEARTEAALYGTPDAIAEKLAALRSAGVRYVLANILGQSSDSLRRFASLANPASGASGGPVEPLWRQT
jgi:alkanesulfonate monooxygenase SsuD/methylene tetrahydromethanopterin reductase-like flavin-dependent oxidoreductase (luciferase family)